MDKDGNLALGYSVASASLYPSICYTGRLAGDPLNTLPQGEATLIAGGGSQTHVEARWGDYSSMSVDPVDDCTFWYTQEYYATTSAAGWQTRIGSFRFPSCVSGPTGALQGQVTAVGGGAITGAQILTGDLTTTTDAAGNYRLPIVPVGAYTVTAAAYGYLGAAATGVNIQSGATTTQDFALSPVTPIQVCGQVTDASGQGWPLYARIDIAAAGPVGPVFSDRLTGRYCVDLFTDQSYTFTVTALSGGYLAQTSTFTATAGNATQDFALLVDAARCNAPGYSGILAQDFNGQEFPPAGWTVVDNAGTGAVWKTSTAWGDGNYTGGTGMSATVNSDTAGSVAYDTELRTPTIDSANSLLSYLANYQEYTVEVLNLDISVDGGTNWTNVSSWNQNYGTWYGLPGVAVSLDLSPYIGAAASYQLRWHYYNPSGGNWDYYAQVDDIKVGACRPAANTGLVIGQVYDGNTNAGINGAGIADSQGRTAVSFAPVGDPQQDGSFILATQQSAAPLTATAGTGYGTATQTPTISVGGVVTQDFYLPAAFLYQLPAGLDAIVPQDSAKTEGATLMNDGALAAQFSVHEFNLPYVAPLVTGPFADHARRMSPAHLNDRNAKGVYVVNAPAASALAAGTVIATWPTGLPSAWGVGYNQLADDLWLGNVVAGGAGGSDTDYRYLRTGTATGDSIDVSGWVGAWAADMTYKATTNKLWQVNVSGDNCVYELDPAAKVSTGNKICPAFGTSERGLAYDPMTDTYYAGSWNDGVINHFAPDGTILDSAGVALNISGLAYNPSTGHLFVMNSWAADNGYDVYVLDAKAGYAVVGGFDIAGLGDFEQASLELDCAGNLWAVNQVTQTVIEAESGETNVCAYADIPWLTVAPNSGTVAAHGSVPLNYNFNTAGMAQGLYEAHVRIANDGPYGDVVVPVKLTVSPPTPTTFALTLAKTGAGSGTVAGGGTYATGATVTLTATADPGSTLTGWSPTPCAASFTMPANDLTCTATFTLNSYAITASASPAAGGTVSCTPNPVDYGGTTTCSATPNASYTFGAWSGDCTGATCVLANVTAAKSVTATFAPKGADLLLSNVVLTPASPLINTTFIATITVRNRGATPGLGRTLQVWADQPTAQACRSVGNKSVAVPRLAAGARTTLRVTGLRAGVAGTKTLRAFIDSTCQTAEADETNNQGALTYTVRAPDFVVSALALTPGSPSANGTFSADVTVTNLGLGDGLPRVLRVWTHRPAAVGCRAAGNKTVVVPSLAAGASTTVRVTGLPAGLAGAKTLRAFIDGTCQTAESDETNNQGTLAYTVVAPDLAVTDLAATPGSPSANGTFSAAVTVTNRGTAASLAGTLQVWANRPPAAPCRLRGDASASVPSLAAGASSTFTLTGLPAGVAGAKTLRAFVDSTCATVESTETNNQLIQRYTVVPPDFVVTGIVLTPGSPSATGTFTAAVTVKNQGVGDGPPRTLQVWANRPAAAGCRAVGNATAALPALTAGFRTTVTVTLPAGLASAAGPKTLRAFVDSGCLSPEPNEANNQRTLAYSVLAPDLVLTGLTITPASPLARNSLFAVNVTVTNQGTAAGVPETLQLWANRAARAACNGTGTTSTVVPSLAAGASTTVTLTGLPAGAVPGVKTLRAFIDSTCATAERNELNNQKTQVYRVR